MAAAAKIPRKQNKILLQQSTGEPCVTKRTVRFFEKKTARKFQTNSNYKTKKFADTFYKGGVFMKKYLTSIMMFLSGGSLYILLELLWRNHTHWTMFFAGGACFSLIDKMECRLKKSTPLWVRCTIGAAIITTVEFAVGCLVNIWAHWNVWDYSRFRTNFMGQICLLYTTFWFFLTVPILWLCNTLHKAFEYVLTHRNNTG